MNILLVIPPGESFLSTNNKPTPPLGLAYCAAVLEKEGHKVTIIDAFLEKLSYGDLVNRTSEIKPDMFGVYFMTDNRFRGFRIIRAIKKKLPNIITIAGGPHPTLAADDFLKHIPELDYIIRGEGEIAFPAFIKAIESNRSLEEAGSLSYRKNGEIIHNQSTPLINNLNEIPFPAYHKLKIKDYPYFLSVPGKGEIPSTNLISSRGCPHRCIFCSNKLLWNGIIRNRSAENFVDEIEFLLKKYNFQAFQFVDDYFTNHKRRVLEICDLILKRNLKFYWSCSARVDTFDEEMARIMKKAGCVAVGYGVESGSQKIIDDVIGKRINMEQVWKASGLLKKYNIQNYPNFIVSFPDETFSEALETLKVAEKITRLGARPVINVLKIYPGTRLEKIAYERKILPPDFTWTDEKFHHKMINAFPAVLGFSPLYFEKMGWGQIGEILFRWASARSDIIHPRRLAFNALMKIRCINDARRLMSLGKAYLKVKFFSC